MPSGIRGRPRVDLSNILTAFCFTQRADFSQVHSFGGFKVVLGGRGCVAADAHTGVIFRPNIAVHGRAERIMTPRRYNCGLEKPVNITESSA